MTIFGDERIDHIRDLWRTCYLKAIGSVAILKIAG